jgi:hypothetical protein
MGKPVVSVEDEVVYGEQRGVVAAGGAERIESAL